MPPKGDVSIFYLSNFLSIYLCLYIFVYDLPSSMCLCSGFLSEFAVVDERDREGANHAPRYLDWAEQVGWGG